jgi:acetyl esterase/lipase
MSTRRLRHVVLAVALAGVPLAALAQSAGFSSAADIARRYRIVPNVTYHTASNFEAKLDVYTPRQASGPVPTVIYIHGGWWISGSKEGSMLNILPYLERGFAAVNVEYRLRRVALAPAAVEDCLCALRWVIRNAKEYNFDVNRIVVSGGSAGGHLALTTGMVPASAGLDRECPGQEILRVAAIVNWYGVSDVNDVIEGPNMHPNAVSWLGSQPDRDAIAKRVSPLTYVRAGQPPVLTVHGDKDAVVPYSHAVRLHEALARTGVSNQLITIPGGGHGGFDEAQTQRIYAGLFQFLEANGVTATPPSTAATR